MDGGDSREHHEIANYVGANTSSRRGIRRVTGAPADRFRATQLLPNRGEVVVHQQPGGNAGMADYNSYTFQPAQYPSNPGSASGNLQNTANLQYSQVYSQDSQQESQPAQFAQYGAGVGYGPAQQQALQSPYETVAQYQPRGSGSIEAIPTQYEVSQYIPQGEPSTAGIALQPTQYITSQPSSFPQPATIDRSLLSQSYASNASDYDPPDTPQETMTSTEEPREPLEHEQYQQYQQSLAQIFREIRADRIGDARDNLLRLSEWLVSNVERTGESLTAPAIAKRILTKSHEGLSAGTYISEEIKETRRKLWEDFNTCWLALVQKQRDTLELWLQTGQTSPSLLSQEDMKALGDRIVGFSDSLEGFGLVDYEMGLWEEEILSGTHQKAFLRSLH